MPKQSSAAIASRAVLRDAMNKLRFIREQTDSTFAGDEGAAEQSTGDPFRDKILAFTRTAKGIRERICERNENQQQGVGTGTDHARESHDVNVMFRQLTHDLHEVQAMVTSADKDLAKANKKKKEKEKIDKLEQTYKARQIAYDNCTKVFEELKDVNNQRNLTEKEVKKMAAMNPDQKKKAEMGSKLREQLSSRLKRGKPTEEDGGEEAMSPKENMRLEDNPETAKQMKELKLKQQKQDAALDRIHAGILRITETARAIGEEMDQQDAIMAQTEQKMDTATRDLKLVNRGLTKLMKDQKPMNVIINVSCFVLLLGLVGFFLFEFGAIV